MSGFHSNHYEVMGLTARTRSLLSNHPGEFEKQRIDAACTRNYIGKLPYHQKYYQEVLKPKQKAAREANPKPDGRKNNGGNCKTRYVTSTNSW